MEKLIDLLNEYEKSGLNEFEKYVEWWYCKWNGKILTGNWENNNELTPYELCSKHYGFIKWLVENEKIKWDEKFYLEDDEGLFGTYECILMQLAIQDEPIEFLVSILK